MLRATAATPMCSVLVPALSAQSAQPRGPAAALFWASASVRTRTQLALAQTGAATRAFASWASFAASFQLDTQARGVHRPEELQLQQRWHEHRRRDTHGATHTPRRRSLLLLLTRPFVALSPAQGCARLRHLRSAQAAVKTSSGLCAAQACALHRCHYSLPPVTVYQRLHGPLPQRLHQLAGRGE